MCFFVCLPINSDYNKGVLASSYHANFGSATHVGSQTIFYHQRSLLLTHANDLRTPNLVYVTLTAGGRPRFLRKLVIVRAGIFGLGRFLNQKDKTLCLSVGAFFLLSVKRACGFVAPKRHYTSFVV